MSQNLMERVMTMPVEEAKLATAEIETVPAAQTRIEREHLTLIEWRGETLPVHLTNAPATQPLRRPLLGWFDAAVIALMLSSAGAGAYLLLHLV